MQSFVDNKFEYLIDQIVTDLVPLFECDYPCRTCQLPNRTFCESCQTNRPTEIFIYLDNTHCKASCPDGFYGNLLNDKICAYCAPECHTCSDINTCTTCKPNSALTDLYDGWCQAACPPGYCPINFTCATCNAPPFLQVTVTANPSTVGVVSSLRLTASMSVASGQYYADGDILWFNVPAPGSFIISNDTS